MAGDTVRREPKYATIAADLAEKIRAGVYDVGAALPGQRELSSAYGVTLMTLRQALQLLADRGLITQHAGRGTFVAGPKAGYSMGALTSLADDLRAQGHAVDTIVLSRARRGVPRWVAEHLRQDVGQPALRVERVRRLAGRPAIHQVSWVPEEYAEAVRQTDLSTGSLYGALATGGVVVHRAQERLSPALLGERLAALLEHTPGAPVFLSDRVTFDSADAPVVFDRATILGEYVEVRTERAAASVSMRWANTASPDARVADDRLV